MTRYRPLISLVLGLLAPLLWSQENMALVHGGSYLPLYGVAATQVRVNDFYLDAYPVSNADYQAFLKTSPQWRKSRVKRLFADASYLNTWESDLSLGALAAPNAPVTNVSWYAAKKYCERQGKRLPTVDEWEYAAMADETRPDARKDPAYNQRILDWYEAPKDRDLTIGRAANNYWGVYDLHGLVWEWTQDFNSVLLSGESRKDVDKDNNLFCGSAAVGASDLMNYAAFMRYAFRGSMKARYSSKNLGFRCAKDAPK